MSHKVSKISHLFALSLLLPLLAVFSSCREEELPVAVTSVSLNSTSIELVEGTTQTLVATVSPSNAENQKVIWSSSNSSVASVTDGVVTAVKAGNATITVKTDDGNKTATCNVTVVAEEISVTSVSLDQTAVELAEGGEVTLTATVKPDDATNKNVSWSSSNSSVASVTDGVVTAVKAGNATITVKTDDGNKTATCNVTVVAEEISVTSVSLDQTAVELAEGGEVTLTATVKPDDATNKNVSWTSSNESVATVDNGKITAVKAGNATITVKTDDGNKTATCNVTVVAEEISVTSVSLDQTAVELAEGGEVTLTATVKPDDATNKNVSWTSSNESVATVDNGKITAVKAGSSIITVTTEDGNKSAICEVTVLQDDKSDAIAFADDIMKELCITAFDTNGDGELSYAEAAAVTDLSQMKLTKKTFKSFDEFQYFTGVTSIPDRYFREIGIKSIILPRSLKSIGDGAFLVCSSLQSITLPESVTSIGGNAFRGCSSLQSITLSESVTSIGDGAFAYCSSLQSITLPESVTSIGGNAFRGCSSLQSITLSESVTSIGDGAFAYCSSLQSITLPESVTSIGGSAFEGCSSLQSITIPESVTSIGDSAFEGCSNLKSITIPESVTSIGDSAFEGCSNLKSITIPESVTSIGDSAFKGCSSLQSITIPESVTRIDSFTFAECSNLKSITLPESVTSIGVAAFSECSSLQSITLPESVTRIYASAFKGCSSLQSITLPESVTSIGDNAFKGCSSLQSITLPESVTSIGGSAFEGCSSLQSITLPESVTSIGRFAFNGCSSLQSITIPESVTSIDSYTFAECSNLKSITIPESVTSIGVRAFDGCSSLQSITLPESVTSIGGSAFYDCSSLKKVYIKSQDCPSLSNLCFDNNAPSRKIYVPYKVLDTYKTTDGWSKYANDIVGYDYENNKVVE